MNECITETTRHFTPAARLAVLGVKLHHMKVFELIEHRVHIAQKTVTYRPIDKLYDGFIIIGSVVYQIRLSCTSLMGGVAKLGEMLDKAHTMMYAWHNR